MQQVTVKQYPHKCGRKTASKGRNPTSLYFFTPFIQACHLGGNSLTTLLMAALFTACFYRDSTARLTYEIRSSDSHSPVAMVNEVGQLLTGARSGHASLIVTAHEDFGVNQTIVMLIKVTSDLTVIIVLKLLKSVWHYNLSYYHSI